MTERRAVARQRTFLKATLAFNNGNSSEDGLVRNLSETGAQIELPHPHAPEAFDLLIPARNSRWRARMVWKNGVHIGVAFDGAVAAAPARPRRPLDDLRY